MMVNNEKGVVMLEFVLTAGVFLMLLGAVVDTGLILQKRSLLNNASKHIARLISINVTNENNCSEAANTINNEGKALLLNKLNLKDNEWEVDWDNTGVNSSFNLSISSKMPCFLLCKFNSNGWNARVKTVGSVNRNMACSKVKL